MTKPNLISGNCHADQRGKVCYNNHFDATEIKRLYIIENDNPELIRAWVGHQIEQRWFSAVAGSFEIQLIKIDDWQQPSKNLPKLIFKLEANALNILHIPKGYISSIQAMQTEAKLLVMADYMIGQTNDEYRFEPNYFQQ